MSCAGRQRAAGRRKAHDHGEPTARHRFGRHRASVRVHHRADDREPQPRAGRVGRAVHRPPPEGLEQLLHPLRGDLGSPRAHVQLGGRPPHARCGPPPSPPGRCAAPRSPRGSRPRARAAPGRRTVGAGARCAAAPAARGRWPRPAPPPARARRGRRGRRPCGGGIDSRRRSRRGPAAAAPPRGRRPGGVASRTTVAHPPQLVDVGGGIGERHVHLGAQHRQRRAQLVAGVGDEPALRLERGLQPVEHRVEAGRQLRDLAAGVAQLQAGVQRLGRQPPRRGRDRVQRPEHPADQPPRHEARGDHDEREGDQPGAQDLGLHRGADGGADLLGTARSSPPTRTRAARREGGNGVHHTADEQPTQPQQQGADQRDSPVLSTVSSGRRPAVRHAAAASRVGRAASTDAAGTARSSHGATPCRRARAAGWLRRRSGPSPAAGTR